MRSNRAEWLRPDGDGGGVVGAVADGDEEVGIVESLLESGGEEDDRLASIIGKNFEIVPSEVGAEAGAESFSESFFGSEAAGEMGHGIFEFIAVVLLALGKEAIEKVMTVSLNALPHA